MEEGDEEWMFMESEWAPGSEVGIWGWDLTGGGWDGMGGMMVRADIVYIDIAVFWGKEK